MEGSYCTVQPAWVQMALNATNVEPDGCTIHAGLPVAGSVNCLACPVGTRVVDPMTVPAVLVPLPEDAGGLVGPPVFGVEVVVGGVGSIAAEG